MTGFVAGLREELVAAAARERARRLPRLWPLAPGTAVAAAAAVLLVGLAALAAGGGLRGDPEVAKRAAPDAGIQGRGLFRGPLSPGARYRTRVLVPPLSFVAPDGGWSMRVPPQVDRVVLEREGEAQLLVFRRLSEVFDPRVRSPRRSRVPAPDDYHGWLRAHPDLRVGPSEPVTVAGVAAEAFDVEVRYVRPAHPDPRCGRPCTAIAPGEAYADGTRLRTTIVWSNPGPLVINQAGRTAADLEEVRAAAAPLLRSLGIGVD